MKCSRNKFWLEHPVNLFCDYTLLPLEGMALPEKMNALTRLVFAIFLVLLLELWSSAAARAAFSAEASSRLTSLGVTH